MVKFSWRIAFVSALALLLLLNPTAQTRSRALPATAVSGAIRIPDDYTPLPLSAPSTLTAPTSGLRAVAIVGDVGSSTATYKQDMDYAVTALQSHGVTVTKFYYGDSTFNWNDIVAAAQGAQFILYMGHGVYSGSMPYPTSVGGFYLGPSQFVSADQIRNDLAGRLADDSVIIFSHACFTAGSAAGDPADLPLSEAQRRVTMYADPFTDLGMQAYFANNYFHSAEEVVNQLLADPATRPNMGTIFLNTYPNNSANHHDLTYPEPGYDLWMNGTAGNWDNAFVGIPTHTFGGDAVPTLGGIPAAVAFLYSIPEGAFTPAQTSVTPRNTTGSDAFTWTLTSTGDGFTVAPTSGSTPGAFTITPNSLASPAVGTWTGAVTVTVTSPPGAQNSPQRIDLSLHVVDAPLQRLFAPLVLKQP